MMDPTNATTPTGVAAPLDAETQFENLWNAGAFDSASDDPSGTAPVQAPAAAAPAAADEPATPSGDAPAPAAQAAEGATPAAPAADDAEAFESLDAMLSAKGVDPAWVRALPVTVKVDGIERQVPLAEVIKSYQLEGHVNNKSIELSNQQREFETARTQVAQALQQQAQRAQDVANLAMQLVNHDYQQVDWNAVRAQDPARYAALHADFQQRQQAVQQVLTQLEQQRAAQTEQQQEGFRQALAQEGQRLLEARPQWRDQTAFVKDRESMVQYAKTLGFKDAELNQLNDHRYMLILHDAARFAQLQASTPQAVKRVREAPVQAKPGARVDTNPQAASRQSAIERFMRNPYDQDAAAAAFEHLA